MAAAKALNATAAAAIAKVHQMEGEMTKKDQELKDGKGDLAAQKRLAKASGTLTAAFKKKIKDLKKTATSETKAAAAAAAKSHEHSKAAKKDAQKQKKKAQAAK